MLHIVDIASISSPIWFSYLFLSAQALVPSSSRTVPAAPLVELVSDELRYLLKKRRNGFMDVKMRDARMLGELVKFQVRDEKAGYEIAHSYGLNMVVEESATAFNV